MRRVVHAKEEVRVATPPAVEECCLVDDVNAVLHRLERRGFCGVELVRSSQRLLVDLANGLAVCPQPLEEGPLVSIAPLLQEDDLRVFALMRAFPATRNPPKLQRRQVIALEETNEVRGADDDGTVRG